MDMIDIGLWVSYLLLIIAVGSAAVLPLLHALKTPSTFLKSLVGIGSLVVLFGISFALSGSDVTKGQEAIGITKMSSKLIGAGLTMFYITLFVSIIGMIFSEINKALK